MLQQLRQYLQTLIDQRDVRVVILQHQGPAFSSGHDLRELQCILNHDNKEHLEQLFQVCSETMISIVNSRIPVIAKVDGIATAAGCQLLASCDLAYATAASRFATPGVNLGLFCATPSVAITRSCGLGRTKDVMEMLLTGQPVSADHAEKMGLINKALPAKKDLDEHVERIASLIATKASPVAVQMGKPTFIQQNQIASLEAAYEIASQTMCENAQKQECKEGIAAFLEKRRPLWNAGGSPTRLHSHEQKPFRVVTRSLATSKQKRSQGKQHNENSKSDTVDQRTGNQEQRLLHGSASQRLILPRTDFSTIDTSESSPASLLLPPNLAADNDTTTASSSSTSSLLTKLPKDWTGYEPATPLFHHIQQLIQWMGRPITVADYMEMALLHPEHGYYTTKTKSEAVDDFDRDEYGEEDISDDDHAIIGPSGDFITAPEVSQMFGECIGVWFLTQLEAQLNLRRDSNDSREAKFQLVECGPGKGTLMRDLLVFLHSIEKNADKLQSKPSCQYVHLIEVSPHLRQLQKETLLGEASLTGKLKFQDSDGTGTSDVREPENQQLITIHWHDSFTAFCQWQEKKNGAKASNSKLPTFCIFQEFLDALPVHVFEKTAPDGLWRERLVDVAMEDEEEGASTSSSTGEDVADDKPRLRIVLAPEVTPALRTLLNVDQDGRLIDGNGQLDPRDEITPIGQIVEVNPQAILLAQDVKNLIDRQKGGAVLFIDYGTAHEGSSDSIRGFERHKQVHFLSSPGQVDVTADVDFGALVHAVNNRVENSDESKAWGPVTQGHFLVSMGIQERVLAEIEEDKTTDEQAENLYNAMVRLASPEEMGERFKVLAITPSGTGPPASFE